jgi:Zn finger protein HypA/HybF involved in hydrogenase expression
MTSAKERAQKLSREIREAIRTARAASTRARTAGEEFRRVLVRVRAEAEAARNVVEYPPGRYECNACHQPVIFSDTQREFPPCDSCGSSRGYSGPPPRVLDVIPATPRKFSAGLYECTQCRAPVALVEGSDTLAPCEFCGATEFRAL